MVHEPNVVNLDHLTSCNHTGMTRIATGSRK